MSESTDLGPQISAAAVAAIRAPKPPPPEPYCAATCPRQATHQGSDCECGGAERQFRAWRTAQDEAARLEGLTGWANRKTYTR